MVYCSVGIVLTAVIIVIINISILIITVIIVVTSIIFIIISAGLRSELYGLQPKRHIRLENLKKQKKKSRNTLLLVTRKLIFVLIAFSYGLKLTVPSDTDCLNIF